MNPQPQLDLRFARRLERSLKRLGLSGRGRLALDALEKARAHGTYPELVAYVDWLLHWKHASASQFKAFDLCKRRWWYAKVAKIPTETTPAMLRGKQVHQELEDYLNHGTFPAHPSAKALLPFLPAPTPGLPNGPNRPYLVEFPLHLVLPGAPVPIIGAIDRLHPGRVVDYKTTSDMSWALTPERLAQDTQAQIYAIAEKARTPGLEAYQVEWLYTTTRGPARGEPRTYQFHPTELDVAVGDIVRRLVDMDALTRAANGSQVPADGVKRDSCFAFNRQCDFFEHCMRDGNRGAVL